MAREEIIVGLDVGTTKIGVIIAEVQGQEEPKIIGVGTSPSWGLRKGVVINLERTVAAIRKAVEQAERVAGTKVSSAYVSIAGDHIKGLNSRGVIAVSGADNEISGADVDRVIEAAKAVAIPVDREIIHVLPQEFIVDDQRGIKDSVGMSGVRLEAEVHIVTGAVTSIQNLCKSIERAGISIRELVLQSLASSYAVLSSDEKELGVVLLDIGGGTTDIAIFFEGSIRHTGVVGLGGNNVTNDIAIGLRTPLSEAENIKCKYGTALQSLVDDDEPVEVPGVGGRPPRNVPKRHLSLIIEPRMEEIFLLALKEIRKTDYADLLGAGVVITGGGSMIKGVEELSEKVFNLPVKRGTPDGVSGLVDAVESPVYATGVGLVLYGLTSYGKEGGEFRAHRGGGIGGFMGKLKRWIKEF